MHIEWADAKALELVTTPGEVEDEEGNKNGGPCLFVGDGGGGACAEGTLEEIKDVLVAVLARVLVAQARVRAATRA